ncbi:MAG TPA: PspC domain-containing protein [Actinomycetota bacterium]|nr:PspC domain-containing protein [Actinomycetota bacterium]
MPHADRPFAPSPARPRPMPSWASFGLRRSPTRRIVAGVAGGLAEQLRVDPTLVRAGFVLLSLCGGVGVLVYIVGWMSLPTAEVPVEHLDAGGQRAVGVGLVIAGVVILLHAAGIWVGTALAWSVGLVVLAVALIWFRGNDSDRARWASAAQAVPETAIDALKGTWRGRIRILAAAGLLAAGVAVFLTGTDALSVHSNAVLAVALTAVGVGLVAAPWGWRMATALNTERRERIRSEERAELAAHLHDSVLQTLALIQRTDQPREMVALARNQERELRAWLSGRPSLALNGSGPDASTLSGELERAAAAVELQFKVPVEVVTVGDTPMDDRLQAVLEAAREAAVNAAKHSGAPSISIYLEVEDREVTAYVRDQGSGFDPESVGTDRQGIAQSIRGRMQRVGGSACITTEPGGGTEVQLVLPRQGAGAR